MIVRQLAGLVSCSVSERSDPTSAEFDLGSATREAAADECSHKAKTDVNSILGRRVTSDVGVQV
jgi:hypothetical protein